MPFGKTAPCQSPGYDLHLSHKEPGIPKPYRSTYSGKWQPESDFLHLCRNGGYCFCRWLYFQEDRSFDWQRNMPDVLLTNQTNLHLPAKMRFPGWQPMCMPSTYWKAFDSSPGWKDCFGDRISQDKTQLWQHLRFLYHRFHCQLAGLHSLRAPAHGSAPAEPEVPHRSDYLHFSLLRQNPDPCFQNLKIVPEVHLYLHLRNRLTVLPIGRDFHLSCL